MRPAFAALALIPLLGCYAYVPVGGERPDPGETVRLHVTEAASTELVPRFGPGVNGFRAMVLNTGEDGISLAIESIDTERGDLSWNGEGLRLDWGKVALLEHRKLSRTRSVLFAGMVALGMALLGEVFDADAAPGADDDGELPPEPGPVS